MSNEIIIVVVLQGAGIAVILAEFIIPSGGILSVIASALIGYSLYLVYTTVSVEAGIIFTLSDIILIPAAVVLGIKLLYLSPATLSTALSSKTGYSGEDASLKELKGKTGKTVTTLRPSGIAEIQDRRVDVISVGDFIEKDTSVTVVEVDGNRVIVAHKE
ncbi:MAG: NfeD family protein [Chitinivibrionales bacterium]